jgi:hypothetical protein
MSSKTVDELPSSLTPRKWGHPKGFRAVLSNPPALVLRYVRNDTVRQGQQGHFHMQRRLIVQQMLPSTIHHKLRRDHGHRFFRVKLLHCLNIGQQRMNKGAIGRFYHDECVMNSYHPGRNRASIRQAVLRDQGSSETVMES